MRSALLLPFLFAFAISAQPATQPAENAEEDFAITRMRVLTTTEVTYFYKEVETTYAKIGEVAANTIEDLEAALEKSGNKVEGNVTFVYLNATEDMNKPFKLQIGMIVQNEGVEFGDFKVRKLPSVKAATVVFCGSIQYIGKVYESLMGSVFGKKLEPSQEMRETYFMWEGPESPNNVTQLQLVLKQ